MKTLILSDLHLGSDASSSRCALDDIRRLARQSDRVILNGDTLDRYEAIDCEPRAAGLIEEVTEACGSRNGPPEMIAGNHDPALSNEHWLYLEESRTLVFHGDCIADWTHPTRLADQILARRMAARWKELGGRPNTFTQLNSEYRSVQAAHALEHPPIRHQEGGLAYVLSILFPPKKPIDILKYWWKAPGLAAQIARTFERPVQNVVVGHSHHSGRWQIDGINVMNTGSFMPLSAPYAVLAEGPILTFQPLRTLLKTARTTLVPLMHGAPAIQNSRVKT